MSRGALHMCGVPLSKFQGVDLGDLLVRGRISP
jgi:hypothetical protein